MGRPKGSKNKAKEVEITPEQEAFNQELSEKGFATTPNKGIFCVDADKFQTLPDNWFSMGKVEKLKFLTANRKK